MGKRVDTEAISNTEVTIDSLITELDDILKNSESIIQNLSTHWTGKGAEASVRAFSQMMTAGVNTNREKLFQYNDFLSTVERSGYEETEKLNKSKADEI